MGVFIGQDYEMTDKNTSGNLVQPRNRPYHRSYYGCICPAGLVRVNKDSSADYIDKNIAPLLRWRAG